MSSNTVSQHTRSHNDGTTAKMVADAQSTTTSKQSCAQQCEIIRKPMVERMPRLLLGAHLFSTLAAPFLAFMCVILPRVLL